MEFDVDILGNLLQSQGAMNGLIALFVWMLKRHFMFIEKKVNELSESMIKIEKTNQDRFAILEDRVLKLEGYKDGDNR